MYALISTEGERIHVTPYGNKDDHSENETSVTDKKFQQQEESLKNEETIAESGRIFVRNLPYTVTEEEIQELFSKYGKLSNTKLMVDLQ